MNNYIENLLHSLKMIILVLPAVSIPSTVSTVTLNFKESVIVNDTAIYLKDIAHVDADLPALAIRIAEKPVALSAPPGHSRFVSAPDIVTCRLKPLFKDINFRSNTVSRILVKTGYIEKKVRDFNDLIIREVEKNIAWNKGDWFLFIKNSEESFKCFDAPLNIELSGLDNRFPRGAMRLQFIARQNGRTTRIPLSCRIMVNTEVLVAKNNIPHETILSINDCEVIKKDITALGSEPFFTTQDLIGKKASRTINAGTIITHQMVRKPPDILKGDNLYITVSRGNVTISVAAVARENGFKGQKIWAQNTASNKLIRVMVTDKNSARLL